MNAFVCYRQIFLCIDLLLDDETTTVDGQDPFAMLTRANKYRSVNLHNMLYVCTLVCTWHQDTRNRLQLLMGQYMKFWYMYLSPTGIKLRFCLLAKC